MTKKEYETLQDRFSKKLDRHPYTGNKGQAYKEGVLACKSILKEVFERLDGEE